MNEQKLLTITIPAYKVENYIEQCLSSMAIEEVQEELEVLVINDGSPDQSGELAKGFEKRYPRIFRVVDKENGGHGSTINAGIRLACGKYFKVVDGDDWLDRTALLHLIEVLKTLDCDIIASNYAWVNEATGKVKQDRISLKDLEYDRICDFEEISRKGFLKMHTLTFRTEILRSCNFKIDEHCFYVDAEYALFPIPKVHTIYFLKDCLYMYRMGREGQSMTLKNMRRNRKQYVRVMDRMLSYYRTCQRSGLSQDKSYYMENALALFCVSYYKILLSYPKSPVIKNHMQSFTSMLKGKYPEVYSKMNNSAVKLLKMTDCRLYSPIRAVFSLLF